MTAAQPLVPRHEAAWAMLSLAAMQGAAFFIQLLVAAALSPADFAIVRTVEAWLSPLLVLAAAGLPSLAMAWLPIRAGGARHALARRFLGTSLLTGGGITVLSAIAIRLAPPAGPYLSLACGLLVLGAFTRTATNLLLADGRVRAAALATATVSLIGIPAATWGARHHGLDGWLTARYLIEVGMLGAILWAARHWLRPVDEPAERPAVLVKTGAMLSFSLLLRSVTDNLGPMAMSRVGFAGVEVGAFALATVGVAALLLPPGAILNLAVRRLSQAAQGDGDLGASVREGIGMVLGLTVIPCIIFLLSGELILGWFFPKYQGSAALMSVVLWAAPWRALGSLMGGVLIATNRSGDTVGLNLVCLMVAGALQWGLVARWGVWGSAWAILLSDLFMLTLYGGYVLLQLGRRGRSQ